MLVKLRHRRLFFFKKKWMPINDYFVYKKCILTYKVLNNLTPEYLNVFQYVSQVSSRITRQSINNLLLYQKLKQIIIDVLLLYRHAIFGIICQMK